MADRIDFKIDGLEEVQAKLKALTEQTAGQSDEKATNFALLRAAQYVRDQAKQSAARFDDSTTGRSIPENIIAKKRSKRSNLRADSLGYRVGVAGGSIQWKRGEIQDKTAGAKTPHWRLLEFGTEETRAQPFMRQALAKNVSTVTSIFVQNYQKKINNILRAMAR